MKRSKSDQRRREVAPGCRLALGNTDSPRQHRLRIDWPIKLAIEPC
jgi:hypothetical protein